MEYDKLSFNLLEVILQGDPTTGNISTCTYRKSCSGNTTLFATSCHPYHTINAIPYAEFISARRNCSTESAFEQECQVISQRLLEIGYCASIIHHPAAKRNRGKLLNVTPENTNMTYNSRGMRTGSPVTFCKSIFKRIPPNNLNNKEFSYSLH